MNIPFYRTREIKKLYEVFCDEEKSTILDYRKNQFYKVLKAKFRWINNEEYQEMYKLIKENELTIIFDAKKRDISQKYKKKIIKLFCNIDNDNNNLLDLDEFKMLMLKFHISDYNNIREMFKEADLNGDGVLSIDEFIEFLALNNDLLEKMDTIIECKHDYNYTIDRRTLLFKDFPGSPLKIIKNWRPCLANLRSPNSIKKSFF
jgi:hypothetical protein